MVGSAVDDWQRSSSDEVHAIRDCLHHGLMRMDESAHGSEFPSHDSVARLELRHVCASANNNATAVYTQGRLLKLAHGDHHVLEVESNGLDLDLNFIGLQRKSSILIVSEMESVKATRSTNCHGQRAALLLKRHLPRRRWSVQIRDHVIHASVEHDSLYHGHSITYSDFPVWPLRIPGSASLEEDFIDGRNSLWRVQGGIEVDIKCSESKSRILRADASSHAGHEVGPRVF